MTRLRGILGFSALKDYLQAPSSAKFCFVDTTVLFAQTYPLDPFQDEVAPIFDLRSQVQASMFTNVNVRAEFLENHRRVLIA